MAQSVRSPMRGAAAPRPRLKGKREMLELNGRNAVVTGGASGIGAGVCEALQKEGLRVASLDLQPGGPADVVLGVRRAGSRGGHRGDAARGRAAGRPRLRLRQRRRRRNGHGALDARGRVGPGDHGQPARRVLHAAGGGASHRRAGQRGRDRAHVVERGNRLRCRLRALQRRQDRDPPHGAASRRGSSADTGSGSTRSHPGRRGRR